MIVKFRILMFYTNIEILITYYNQNSLKIANNEINSYF